jgi:hypothetical protein
MNTARGESLIIGVTRAVFSKTSLNTKAGVQKKNGTYDS